MLVYNWIRIGLLLLLEELLLELVWYVNAVFVFYFSDTFFCNNIGTRLMFSPMYQSEVSYI